MVKIVFYGRSSRGEGSEVYGCFMVNTTSHDTRFIVDIMLCVLDSLFYFECLCFSFFLTTLTVPHYCLTAVNPRIYSCVFGMDMIIFWRCSLGGKSL